MDNAFVWVIRNGGIDDEATYPYTSGSGTTGACNTGLLNRGVARFANYVNLPQSEEQMATWVCEYGPLSIAVDAAGWQTYTGGVVTNCGGTTLDHGVLIVGFDAEANPPFWIVKNSWGTAWGEAGYILLAMGSNQCGLALTPCSSVV
jgi:C1A family cysteine protease